MPKLPASNDEAETSGENGTPRSEVGKDQPSKLAGSELQAHLLKLQCYVQRWIVEQNQLLVAQCNTEADSQLHNPETVASNHSVWSPQSATGSDTPGKFGPRFKLTQSRAVSASVRHSRHCEEVVRSNDAQALHSRRSSSLLDMIHSMEQAEQSVHNENSERKSQVVDSLDGDRESQSKMARYPCFEAVCAVVILANTVTMGVQSDYDMRRVHGPDDNHLKIMLRVLEIAFLIFYAIEVIIRFVVSRAEFFRGPDWRWNAFDCFLVFQALLDQASDAWDVGNLSFLRFMRVLKMLKLLRMIRLLRVFRELRLIIYCLLGSAKSMLWALFLIGLSSYMFGIALLQGCTHYLNDNQHQDINQNTVKGIHDYWSTVIESMLSLYMATLGGEDWAILAKPLKEVGVVYYLVFLIYIAFFTFGLLNILASLFFEAMMKHAESDDQAMLEEAMLKKDLFISKLRQFYDEIDDDGDGIVSYKEFRRYLRSPKLQAFAAGLQLDSSDILQFFGILSDGGRQAVDIETFVVGCIKLKGLARSMDLMGLSIAHRQHVNACEQFRQDTKKTLESLLALQSHLVGLFSVVPENYTHHPNIRTQTSDDSFWEFTVMAI